MDDPNTVTITTKEQSMFVFKLLVVSAVVRRTWTALLTEMNARAGFDVVSPKSLSLSDFVCFPSAGCTSVEERSAFSPCPTKDQGRSPATGWKFR
jgi:hypothetical protein